MRDEFRFFTKNKHRSFAPTLREAAPRLMREIKIIPLISNAEFPFLQNNS